MADIRLKKITVESSPLVVQFGDVIITNTTVSSNAATGTIVSNGGIGINCTDDSSSNTAGGGLTVGGGVGIMKTLQVGQNIIQDTSSGLFRVKGLSDDRFFIDSSTNKQIIFRPDGANTRLSIKDTFININITTDSTNNSTGALVVNGGVSIISTTNSSSPTQGGSLTVAGGVSVGGKMYVGEGIQSIYSNTIGNLFTTGGNVGVGTTNPDSTYRLDVSGRIRTNIGMTAGCLYLQTPTGLVVADTFLTAFDMYGVTNGGGWVIQDPSNWVGLTMRQTSNNKYTTIRAQDNKVELLNYTGGTAGTTRTDFVVDTNGNVGVGVNSPQFTFDVNGTINAINYTGGTLNLSSGITAASLNLTNGLTAGNILATSNISTANLQVINISSGTILINTGITSPSALITQQVSTNVTTGTLNATGITTSTLFSSNANILQLNVTHETVSSLVVSIGASIGSVLATGMASLNNNSNTIGSIFTTGGSVGINVASPQYTVDINGGLHANGIVTLSSTTASVNSSYGALILQNGGLSINATTNATSLTRGGGITVDGGASIGKSVYIGGDTYFKSTTPSTSYSIGAVNVAGGLTISGNQNVANIGNGGALTVAGGASIGLDLYIGGQINGSGSSSSTFAYLTLTATDEAVNITTGALVTFGGITVQCTTNATSVTNGGSLLVDGGASFGRDIYIGQRAFVYGSANFNSPTKDIINFYDSTVVRGFSIDFDLSSKDFSLSRYDTNGVFIEPAITVSRSQGFTTFSNTTPSTSSNSASLILSGGISVNTTQNVISLSNGGGLTVRGGQSINKNLLVGGDVIFLSTTQSNDVSSGCLVVAGGVGVTGNFNVLGNTILNGDLTVRGATTSVVSNNTVLSDNVLVLNSGPSGSKDSGFVVQRYQVDNDVGSGDVVNDAIYISDILPLQDNVVSTQVILSASASNADGYYNGWWVKVASGFSNNQVRKITGYVGNTRLATLSSQWTTQNPAVGDNLYIYNKPYVGLIYNEINDRFEFGATVTDPGSGNVTFTERLPLYVSTITCVSTQHSANASTGGILTSGGLTITNTTDSTSVSSGGTITTLGGASISKTLRVGNNLFVSGVNLTPNTQDIFTTISFSAANNQVSATDITGIAFNSTVWGFDVYLAARLIATNPLYTNFHIRGVNKNGSWEIIKSYVGDDTGIEFFITSGGQLQYTTPNYTGFSSLVFKTRAFVN